MTILEKLHVIENQKTIYNIHYCAAGVGFSFYYPEKDKRDGPESWRRALAVDRYYTTFEKAVEAEFKML